MVGKVDNAKYFSEVIDAKRAANNVKIRLGYGNHQMLCQLNTRVPSIARCICVSSVQLT